MQDVREVVAYLFFSAAIDFLMGKTKID